MSITWEAVNLNKDAEAITKAKVVMGWASMTREQQMLAAQALIKLAQRLKEGL